MFVKPCCSRDELPARSISLLKICVFVNLTWLVSTSAAYGLNKATINEAKGAYCGESVPPISPSNFLSDYKPVNYFRNALYM